MPRSKKLPAWATTHVSVESSLTQIRSLCKKHGADEWSIPENKSGDIQIFFSFRGVNISLVLQVQPMIERLRVFMPRTREDILASTAQKVIARQAYNYLKITFEVIATGMFTPAEALLPHVLNAGGERLVDAIARQDSSVKRLSAPTED